MRGNASAPGLRRWYARITPAYAGKRAVRLDIQESEPGSPPRMRGNVSIFCGLCTVVGITPAYAGKRSGPLPPSSRTRDHPRVCGETPCPPAGRGHRRGSPPRMRGNAKQIQPTAGYQGITPAYAGKRWFHEEFQPSPWDHPRICGEKSFAFALHNLFGGSPPHMRGKAGGCHPNDDAERITPAYAGKSNRRNGA